MAVHAVDLRREEGRLISSGAAANLNDHVSVIIAVLGEKEDLELIFQFLRRSPGLGQFFLGQLAHLLIGLRVKQLQRILY